MGQEESAPALPENELEVEFSNKDLSEIPYYISPSHGITSLDLSGNVLNHLPISLKHLQYYDISNNSLSRLDYENIRFDFPELKSLRLSQNGFQHLPHIETLTNLKDLTLDRNELTNDGFNFSSMDHLETLDLLLNYYTEFPVFPDSLIFLNVGFNRINSISCHLNNLRELRIPGNEITEFSEECLFPALEILDLSMNRLVSLPKINSFAPNLTILLLAHNFLPQPPEGLPATIKTLNLSHNVIKTWEVSFAELVNLTKLDISHNLLTMLPQLPENLEHLNAEYNLMNEAYPIELSNLNTLQLNSNKFTHIPDICRSKAAALIMRNNQLEIIDPDKISKYTHRIDLTGNRITELPETLFDNIKIQFLNVTGNLLKAIPEKINMLKLTTLFIGNNDISSIPALPPCLITIIASNCKFTELPQSLWKVTRLCMMDFSCNQISNVTKLPNCAKINLSLNKITQIDGFPEKLTHLDLAHNCLKQFVMEGEDLMIQDLDLSNNQITVFKTSPLQLLNQLKISNNPLKIKFTFNNYPSLRNLDIAATQSTVTLPLPVKCRELVTSDPNIYNKLDSKICKLYTIRNCGYSETIGSRTSMEDTLIIRSGFAPGLDIYAVIDGHGGAETATQAAFLIPKYFAELGNKAIGGISHVIRKVNQDLMKLNTLDGAAIVFVIVTATEIGCAHLGDSRAVLVRKDKSILSLTVDHKPTERSEIDLVKENRSYVIDDRTAGILAVSRSIGDFIIPGVSHIPDMTNYPRQECDCRLVLACDGVFDVISNEEIGNIVGETTDPFAAACLLRNTAYSRGSTDNISVVVVDLD